MWESFPLHFFLESHFWQWQLCGRMSGRGGCEIQTVICETYEYFSLCVSLFCLECASLVISTKNDDCKAHSLSHQTLTHGHTRERWKLLICDFFFSKPFTNEQREETWIVWINKELRKNMCADWDECKHKRWVCFYSAIASICVNGNIWQQQQKNVINNNDIRTGKTY